MKAAVLEKGGRVIVFGLCPHDEQAKVIPFDVTSKELSILGTWLNPSDTFKRATDLLEQGSIKVAPLVSNRVTLENILEGFNLMMEKPGGVIKVIVEME